MKENISQARSLYDFNVQIVMMNCGKYIIETCVLRIGFRADANDKNLKGHAPLPVRFIHMIGDEFKRLNDKEISIFLKSKYFINAENRLVTDKEK
ncbi:MAG: hypothetical protein CL726_11675 [Chloroflexi bacterium]|nr:hypothetical protein [Chloroflexota bacterium]|tara:strand:- start:1931 stop:2215 length:285 start_codon:yes stop_codon:yes gene_type:complete